MGVLKRGSDSRDNLDVVAEGGSGARVLLESPSVKTVIEAETDVISLNR
jgi:hypothetical protein